MEDALVQTLMEVTGRCLCSLNPCFNGRCTRTAAVNNHLGSGKVVLILVLMEDALVRDNWFCTFFLSKGS